MKRLFADPRKLLSAVFVAALGICALAALFLARSHGPGAAAAFLPVAAALGAIWAAASFVNGCRQKEIELLRAARDRLVAVDPVSGALARPRFIELAEMEFIRARRYGHALSVLILDTDRLRAVNEAHGFSAGDHVLRRLVETCRGELRSVDLLGRLDGGEFIAVLPDTELAGAEEVGERLRRCLASAPIPLTDGREAARITASIGVAVLSETHGNVEALIKCAGGALYLAKEGGRNRVAIAR